MRRSLVIVGVIGFLLGCLLFCTVRRAEASESPIWDNLLAAFYLSGGGNLDYSPDPKDGYATVGHLEPRYHVGAGFSFDVTDRVEFDIGYRYQAMMPIPGRAYDKLDWSHIGYIELRFRPFRKD